MLPMLISGFSYFLHKSLQKQWYVQEAIKDDISSNIFRITLGNIDGHFQFVIIHFIIYFKCGASVKLSIIYGEKAPKKLGFQEGYKTIQYK